MRFYMHFKKEVHLHIEKQLSSNSTTPKKTSLEKDEHTSCDGRSSRATQNPAYFLSYSDNPGIPLVAATLNGDNYRTWSRSMKTALRAKTKLGFIDGSITKPLISKIETGQTQWFLPGSWIRLIPSYMRAFCMQQWQKKYGTILKRGLLKPMLQELTSYGELCVYFNKNQAQVSNIFTLSSRVILMSSVSYNHFQSVLAVHPGLWN